MICQEFFIVMPNSIDDLSGYQIVKMLNLAADHSISEIAEKFHLTYPDTRTILKQHGIQMRRGRRRGSGTGLELSSGSKTNRRMAQWMRRKIEQGLCTSCSEPNDSESLYHCKACLKRRNDQAKKRKQNRS